MCIIIKNNIAKLFNSVNENNITGNKKFWKTLKPVLSSKSITNKNIISVENDNILSNDNKIAEVLNNFFSNTTKTLVIPQNVNSYFL